MKKYTFIFFSSKSDLKQEKTILAGDVNAAKHYFLSSLRNDGHKDIQIIATVMPPKK